MHKCILSSSLLLLIFSSSPHLPFHAPLSPSVTISLSSFALSSLSPVCIYLSHVVLSFQIWEEPFLWHYPQSS